MLPLTRSLTRRPHHRSPRPAALALVLFVLVLASALLIWVSATGAKQANAPSSSSAATPTPTYTYPPTPTATPVPEPILLTDPVQDPRSPGVVWFPSTGHTLRGPFLDYWTSNGGLAQFGYPLTEEFFEPAGGAAQKEPLQVQYFERARFEYHPQNQPPYDVLLATLGGVILDFELVPANITDLQAGYELLEEHTNLDAVADKGYISKSVAEALEHANNVCLMTVPRANQKRQLPCGVAECINRVRQIIETVNGQLVDQLTFQTNHAHTFRALCTRLYTKLAAHTLCIYINRLLGKADFLHINQLAFPI